MPQNFGARLRQRREEQAIALSTIAEQTKIKLSLLEALERDDVSQWPSGIFRRAFIRAYAHAIGLNPDVVVREFLEVHPEPAEVAVEAIAAKSDEGRTNSGPPTRLRYIMGSAIGSLARLRRTTPADDHMAGPEPVRVQRATALVTRIPQEDAPRDAVASDDVMALLPQRVQEEPETAPSPEPDAANETTTAAGAEPPSSNERLAFQPDLAIVARLCTELGRIDNAEDLQQLLRDAARVLDATGLIVWLWDGIASELRPALAHGYSDRVLAQLPPVTADADNATAAAFRSAQACAINGSERAAGALAVPLLTPSGCGGVLAIELQHGNEQESAVRSVATIFAAMLAQLIGSAQSAEAEPPVEAIEPVRARRYSH